MKQVKNQKADVICFRLTLLIVLLMIVCSLIGLLYPPTYEKQLKAMLTQTVGQDYSNLFVIAPALIISVLFLRRGNRIARLLWAGTLLTNIYSYFIYCFAMPFNFLFHFYCAVLGLSLYTLLFFCISGSAADIQGWYGEGRSVKLPVAVLITIASLFTLLWLKDSLPAVLTNTAPQNVMQAGMLTNPVQVLDFSFFLPLMFISAALLHKRYPLGYLLAPVALTFSVLTCLNIIILTVVSLAESSVSGGLQLIVATSLLGALCLVTLLRMLIYAPKKPES